jgi:hypothetical protein
MVEKNLNQKVRDKEKGSSGSGNHSPQRCAAHRERAKKALGY